MWLIMQYDNSVDQKNKILEVINFYNATKRSINDYLKSITNNGPLSLEMILRLCL